EKPSIVAVLRAQRKDLFPSFARLQGLLDVGDDSIDMVGVMYFFPACSCHLLRRGSSVIVPAAIVPGSDPEFVARPGEVRNIVGQDVKTLLAFAHIILDLLTLFDVIDHSDPADTFTLVIERRSVYGANPPMAYSCVKNSVFIADHLTA